MLWIGCALLTAGAIVATLWPLAQFSQESRENFSPVTRPFSIAKWAAIIAILYIPLMSVSLYLYLGSPSLVHVLDFSSFFWKK